MFLASHRLPLPAASLARSVRSTGMHADKSAQQDVTSVDASNAATRDVRARRIVVRGELDNAPSIYLARGQALIGDDFSRIVNGVLTKLWAIALSIKPGGSAQTIELVAAGPCSDRHDWGRPHTESLTAMEPRGAPFPMRFV